MSTEVDSLVARIQPPDAAIRQAARQRQDRLTKPPGSLGRLEDVAVQVAAILGSERPSLRDKALIIAAADHGVVTEGVSGYPQAVTGQMVRNFLAGGAAINALARQAGVRLTIVDAGVAAPPPDHPQLRRLSFGPGTGNIARGPAMTRERAEGCILAGIELARDAADSGADLIGIGDMGIGNTTVAAAVTAAITGHSAAVATGRGTGRSDAQLDDKANVVRRALEVNRPDPGDGLDVLAKVGGYELGVLAGVILGGALASRVVVLDGFICGAAALIAHRICPTAIDFCIAGHRSAERGHALVLDHLGLEPLLDLELRLGEGSGAVLAMGLIEAAAACLAEMSTFDEAGVSDAGAS